MNNIENSIKLHITKYNDMLHGSEDHCIGILNDNIIVCGGFCSGLNTVQTPQILKNKVNPKTNYTRGFIDKIFCYSIKDNTWKKIGNIPINPRQLASSIVLGDKMYIWGGFSYTPLTNNELEEYKIKNIPLPSKKDIYSYADGFYLTYNDEQIKYSNCPYLPFPLVGTGIVKYEKTKTIYFVNGCIYDSKSFNTHIIAPYTNIPIGKSFFSMKYDDYNNIIPNSIEFINNFPGSPRLNSVVTIIDDFIYVIGGVNTTKLINNNRGYNEYTYHNIIDNWKYDILNNKWKQIENTPIPICNMGSVLYKNRYILLFGGLKFNTTYNLDNLDNNCIVNTNTIKWNFKQLKYNGISSIENKSITNNYQHQYNWYFSNITIIYDTVTNNFEKLDLELPININNPITISHTDNGYDSIYIVGGEGNPILINNVYYGNCLSIMLKINITCENFTNIDADN